MTKHTVGQAPIRWEPSRYSNRNASFSVQIEVLEDHIYLLTKTGYQTLDDVDAEADLITSYLAHTEVTSTPYLCVDVTQFKGLSRKTRTRQAKMVDEMPFGGVAAFGLSLPLRVFAMAFVRRTETRPIRIFGDREHALEYLQRLRLRTSTESLDTRDGHSKRSPSGPLPNHLMTRYANIRQNRRFGDHEYPCIKPSEWTYKRESAPFEVTNSLLGSDIILSESSGRLTASVVNETEAHMRGITDVIGTQNLYFIHDARDVYRVERTARIALRARYARNPQDTKLTVIVGRPMHAIMVRWIRALAPSIFKTWTMTTSIEAALEVVDAHRNAMLADQRRARSNGAPVPQNTRDEYEAKLSDQDWIPKDPDELIHLVKEQRQLLDEQGEMLGQIIDRLGRMSWDETPTPSDAPSVEHLGAPYDLVFGALDLMDSDIRETIDTLNAHMAELKESQHHLKTAQKVARLGSWEWHVPTGAVKWSDETFRIFGYAPHSIDPTYAFFLEHLDPATRSVTESAVNAALETDHPLNVQQVILRPDGSQAVCVFRGYVERDTLGAPLRMYGTTHDITELFSARATEKRLNDEMAARESALRETLLDLSHDVRTPLASLKLGLGRISGHTLDHRLQSSLIAEVEYLDGLFSNLIALVRLKGSTIDLKMSPTSLQDILDRVKARLGILADDQNVSLDIALPGDTISVHADPLAIEQAIGNLVHNAIKFATAHVAVLLEHTDSEAIFEIRDDGPGMSAMEIPRVTDRYYQGLDRANKAGRGLGLGLPIAQAIAHEHGGTLSITRMEDKVTVVKMTLPLDEVLSSG